MTLTVLEIIAVISIIFAISLLLMFLTYRTIECFLLWIIVVTTFFIYVGLLDFWVIILLLFLGITVIVIVIYRIRSEM